MTTLFSTYEFSPGTWILSRNKSNIPSLYKVILPTINTKNGFGVFSPKIDLFKKSCFHVDI